MKPLNPFAMALLGFIGLILLDMFYIEESFLKNNHVLYWPAYVAIIMIVASVISFPVVPISYSLGYLAVASMLFASTMIIGMIYISIRGFSPAYAPIPPQSEMNCPHQIWTHSVMVTQGHGYIPIEETRQPNFTGDFEKWYEYEENLLQKYLNTYPQNEYTIRINVCGSVGRLPDHCKNKLRQDVINRKIPDCR